MRIARTEEALHALGPAWNEMLAHSAFDGPFHSWDWHRVWWKHLGHGASPFVITAADRDDRLEIIAPLMKRRRRHRGLVVTEISFMANTSNPYDSVLHREGIDPSDALARVLIALNECRHEWDVVRLRNIRKRVLDEEQISARAKSLGLRTLCGAGWSSAYIDIEAPFPEYLSTRLGKRRRGILQKVRKASQLPDYRVDDAREPQQMGPALDRAFAVSASSWKKQLDADMGGASDRRGFYEEITPLLAERSQVRVWTSSLGPTPLALQYNLVSPDTMYLLFNDFNGAYGDLSPGTVLLYEVLDRLHQERSIGRFQFVGHLYDYKSHWATGVEEHLSLEVFHKGAYSRALWNIKTRAIPSLEWLVDRLHRVFSRETP